MISFLFSFSQQLKENAVLSSQPGTPLGFLWVGFPWRLGWGSTYRPLGSQAARCVPRLWCWVGGDPLTRTCPRLAFRSALGVWASVVCQALSQVWLGWGLGWVQGFAEDPQGVRAGHQTPSPRPLSGFPHLWGGRWAPPRERLFCSQAQSCH